jgi:small subunit ribosomal protein S8
MSMSDPLADMLTRIRNAVNVKRKTVDIPASKVHRGVATVLQHEGYIERFEEVQAGNVQGTIRVFLKYGPDGEKVIQEIKRVSKPGCRIYSAIGDVDPIMSGMGITILSTSQGVMSDRQARKLNIGGEVLCTVC